MWVWVDAPGWVWARGPVRVKTLPLGDIGFFVPMGQKKDPDNLIPGSKFKI